MSAGFVKLYATILTSSIWLEPDSTLRVWIAMLATADPDGVVSASVGGLAHVSRVSRKRCEKALETFLAPDPDSRTEDNEGRRIEKVDGGWRILNHQKYRDLRTPKQVSDAERIRKLREEGKYDSNGPIATDATKATNATRSNVAIEADAEAEVEADSETTKASTTARDWLADSLAALRIAPNRVRNWETMLSGMTEGIGSPGGRGIPWDVLHEAATELGSAPGDVGAHRFKKFVEKVIQRRSDAKKPRAHRNGTEPTDRAQKSHAAISRWLAKAETTDAEVIEDGE